MKRVALNYTELDIYPRYVVARTQEGVSVDIDKHRQVMNIIRSEIDGPFGFIIEEKNDYSVKFEVMLDMKRDKYIACGAIIAYRHRTLKALACAIDFIGKPTRVFGSIDEATQWVDGFLKENYPVEEAV